MKILGYIFGAILLIYLILCFMGPAKIEAQRSTVIDAPPAAVYNNVSDFKNWPEWMAWAQKDPSMTYEYGEQTSGVGASYSWKSENQGNGSMKIVAAEPNQSMKTEIDFGEMGTSYGSWQLEPTDDNQTKVTWGMNASEDVNFFMRGMLLAAGVQGTINDDFDTGLDNLKNVVETAQQNLPTTYDGMEIKTVEQPERTYVGIRKTMPWSEMTQFYTETFPAAVEGVTKTGAKMAGMPSGLFYEWDTEGQKTDMAAVVPVSAAPEAVPEGMTVMTTPAGNALQADYYGPYAGSGTAHNALEKYMQARGLEALTPVSEEYMNDPTTVDSTEIHTRIIYRLKETGK